MTLQVALTFMSGPHDGETITVEAFDAPPSITIGRTPEAPAAVSLPEDAEASRVHARLFHKDVDWWLEDLNSLNGTFLGEFGGRRLVEAVPLGKGDIFRIGLTRIRFAAAELPPKYNGTTASGDFDPKEIV